MDEEQDKSEKEKVIKEYERKVIHDRPEPEDNAPTNRPQSQSQNKQKSESE